MTDKKANFVCRFKRKVDIQNNVKQITSLHHTSKSFCEESLRREHVKFFVSSKNQFDAKGMYEDFTNSSDQSVLPTAGGHLARICIPSRMAH